jgi:hypothetical protein
MRALSDKTSEDMGRLSQERDYYVENGEKLN